MHPEDYRPLDGFWRKRGYRPLDGVATEYVWKDVGEDLPTAKSMQFWLREL
jgi:hypothetical protein